MCRTFDADLCTVRAIDGEYFTSPEVLPYHVSGRGGRGTPALKTL